MRVIVGITGASGVVYGARLLEVLKDIHCEVYLIISNNAKLILREELGINWKTLASKADHYFEEDNIEAPIASGTFLTSGMVIAPCSTKTLAAIANGLSVNLIARAAECTLKEGRKLILVVRETPLSLIHIINMMKVTMAGGIILPACPAFYHRPKSVNDLVDYVVAKILDQLGIEHDLISRWNTRK